jgi:DNA-binding transcriptional MerR regulator
MAFNFGPDMPPAPQKVAENGYAVGQENGYAGVRVRIKSLKHAKKENVREPAAEATKEEPLKEATPANGRQETARVVELKLFDLPAGEAGKDVTEVPADRTGPLLPGEVTELSAPVEVPADLATGTGSMETAPVGEAPPEDYLEDEDLAGAEPSRAWPVVEDFANGDPVVELVAAASGPYVEPGIPPTDSAMPMPIVEENIPDAAGSPPSKRTVRAPDSPPKSKRGRKSLKQVAAEADLIEVPGDDILFSKQYYTMRAVAEMFRVNQSLLRFWETEFDILQPRKNKKGDRYFRPVDIKNLHLIYHLLRQRKYTIEGAKEFLKTNKKAEERFEAIQRLQQLKAFLLEWKAQL